VECFLAWNIYCPAIERKLVMSDANKPIGRCNHTDRCSGFLWL